MNSTRRVRQQKPTEERSDETILDGIGVDRVGHAAGKTSAKHHAAKAAAERATKRHRDGDCRRRRRRAGAVVEPPLEGRLDFRPDA